MSIICNNPTTRANLRVWWELRGIYRPFNEAIIGTVASDRYRYTATKDGVGIERAPGLVLITEPNVDGVRDELWLNQCGCGYWGEGPRATAYILYTEGFPSSHIDFIPSHAGLHLKKDEVDPIVSDEYNPRGEVFDQTMSQYITQMDKAGRLAPKSLERL